jgi:carboxyl-terminal processing protease
MLRILLLCLYPFSIFSALGQSFESKATDAWLVTRMVEKFHVEPKPLNKDMSAAIYTQMLRALDGERIFFTKDDIAQLSVYRDKLDEEILNRRTNFLQLVTSLYQHRLMQVDTMVDHIAARPFIFSGPEKLTVMEDSSYPADQAAMRTKIYKLMKLSVATRLADRIATAGGKTDPKMVDSLEPKLRKKAVVAVKRMIKRLMQSPTGIGNMIGIVYCQALAGCYDPHTAYFSPDEKAEFESMLGNKALSYGLTLREDEDGHAVVGHLQPGGPAFQSGALNKGDRILTVRWDNRDPIDVADATAAELQSMLGDEGSDRLTLDVRKTDGTTRQVSLQKQKVNTSAAEEDENKVKGFLLKGAKTVGYISLPAFYADWEDSKGTNGCANDVAKEILKLKKENIGALILDLRYNGGGSMEEAVALSGLFIDAGPVGQVKDREAKVFTMKDVNRGTVWDGPLLVLVNGSSASASEMLAGTLQDYNRALILGSPTYGKATAQVVLPMDTTLDLSVANDKATATSYIKITTSKLYRVNGATAQASGIKPDILLPDPPEAVTQRESGEPFALAPTPIEANKYYHPLPALPVAAEQAIANQAMDANAYFRLARQAGETGKKGARDQSLNINDIIAEKQKEAGGATADSALKKNEIFTVASPAYENQRLQADETMKRMNEERKSVMLHDPYLMVAYQVAEGMMK